MKALALALEALSFEEDRLPKVRYDQVETLLREGFHVELAFENNELNKISKEMKGKPALISHDSMFSFNAPIPLPGEDTEPIPEQATGS